MSDKKYSILFFNMSRYMDWQTTGVVNRNYHMVHTLAESERVDKIIAVDFLPFNWKRALKVFIQDHLLKTRRGEIVYGDLTTQVWQVTSKIHVFSTIDSVVAPQRVRSELQRVLAQLGVSENLVVWNYDPLYTDYFATYGEVATVFDAVDNWMFHSSYAPYRELLERNYKEIVARSDLIYTVSEDLAQFLDSPKTHWLPNAVAYDHFQLPGKLPSISQLAGPILGFLGILQDRIDIELIEKIAVRFPHASIVLAGPVWKNFDEAVLAKYANIHLIGPVSYGDLPALYNTFDVGMILYKRTDFIQSTNSMKFYEYLAAGLPVVTTYSGGAEQFRDQIYIAEDHEHFLTLIEQALREDSPYRCEARKEFVQPMTWKNRIEQVFSDLDSL